MNATQALMQQFAGAMPGGATPALGGSMQVHNLHRLGMWIMMTFAVIHIYAAIREDIMSRQSLISTMVMLIGR